VSGASSLSPGQLLAGRYEVLATLGKGGMGVVYKAHDRVLNETVAIKVLRQDLAESPEMAQRFLAEIKLARSVSHRNVCRIHEYGQDGDVRYISMAYVDGVDLKQVLRERGRLPPAEAFELAIGVAEGLQAIHDEGIIHRDLKAPNLMLDARGVVRLMDFGIAKQWNDKASAGLTATGMIMGTPEYMSPEQVLGQKLDLRSDLYALGVVVYELFVGITPFQAETPVGLLMKHLHDPPALDAAGLPPALVPVLARALAKDRESRHASAGEMADALREARRATTGASGPRTAPQPRPVPERTTLIPRPSATVTTPLPAAAAAPAPTAAAVPPTQASAAPARRSWALPIAGGAAALVILVLAGAAVALRGRATPSPSPDPSAPPTTAVAVDATPAPTPSAPAPPPTLAAAASPAPPPRASAPAPRREGTPARAANPEVEGLLAEAETAFAAQQHQAALAFYEEALRLDPANARARIGRELCTNALAQAAVVPARPPRAFASGRTEFTGRSAAPTGPAGFESSTGVAARRVDQPAAAPGKLVFEVEPPAVRAGEAFVVKIYMVNEGSATLRLAEATVATTTDGRTASGPVGLLAQEAPPRQRTLILSTGGQWRAEVASWSLAVTVRMAGGDSYRNELAWK
jgi:eukaryotic-like serine/threonine-protein kinase